VLRREFELEFPLWHGNAEEVPLSDASFDLAISEYGASIWCDSYRWIPEAARLLRPHGLLTFLTNGVLAMLTIPDEENVTAPTGCYGRIWVCTASSGPTTIPSNFTSRSER
jgi:ubiquinone/menaquinone biosynthesis C-methylase UbiE